MSELNLLPRELHTPRSVGDRALDWAFGRHIVGIDVAADALRAAHVRRHLGRTTIVQTRQIPLPSLSSLAAAVHDNAAITAAFATLRDLLRRGGMPERASAVLGVRDAELVAVRRLDAPWATGTPRGLAESMLRQQAFKLVPRQTAAAAIGWEFVNSATAAVSTAAADLRILEPLLAACRSGGWEVAAVEPTAWALRRLLPFTIGPDQNSAGSRRLVWIDVGGSVSALVVFRDGAVEHAQDVTVGTNELGVKLREYLDALEVNPNIRTTIEAFLAGRDVPPDAVLPPGFDDVAASLAMRLWDAFAAPNRTASSIGALWLSGVGGRVAVLRAAVGAAFQRAALPSMLSSGFVGETLTEIDQLVCVAAIGHAMRTARGTPVVRWEDATSVAGTTRLVAAPPERPDAPPYRPSDLELSRFLRALALRVETDAIDVGSGRGMVDACNLAARDRSSGSAEFGRALARLSVALHGKEARWTAIVAGHLVLPPEVALALVHLQATAKTVHAERFLNGCAQHIDGGRTDQSTVALVASFVAGS